jgi:hypothetical protein
LTNYHTKLLQAIASLDKMRKKVQASTEYLAKTKSEIMTLEVSILSKSLEIRDLNHQLKSPLIILPSYKPHDLLSRNLRQNEESESVENHPISNDSHKNRFKTSSRRSSRVIVDSDSEFEAKEAPQKGIEREKKKKFDQGRSSNGNHKPRNRSSKHEIGRETTFSVCASSSENVDCEHEVTEVMAIDGESNENLEFSDESMVLQEGSVQHPLGKVDIKHFLY